MKHILRTSEQWPPLIHECQSSGMGERQWCILNDIPTSSFYYQMKKLRAEACEIIVHRGSKFQLFYIML